jgi:hypothetical protein
LDLWIRDNRRAFDHAQEFAAHRSGVAQSFQRSTANIDRRLKPIAAWRQPA